MYFLNHNRWCCTSIVHNRRFFFRSRFPSPKAQNRELAQKFVENRRAEGALNEKPTRDKSCRHVRTGEGEKEGETTAGAWRDVVASISCLLAGCLLNEGAR